MIVRGTTACLALLAAVCGPVSLVPPHPSQERIEVSTVTLGKPRPQLDLLVVIDRSPAMLDHREALAGVLNELGCALAGWPHSYYDLHLGVVAADLGGSDAACPPYAGAGRLQSTLPKQPYLSVTCGGKNNFAGTMPAAITSNGMLPPVACGRNQALLAMQMALAADDVESPALNPGFVRPGSSVSVLFVAATDDASQGADGRVFAPADLLAAIEAQHPVRTVTLTSSDTPRLSVLGASCPAAEPLDAPSHAGALRCLIPEVSVESELVTTSQIGDRSPEVPGLQPDCQVTVRRGNTPPEVIPPCGSDAEKCWQLVAMPDGPSAAVRLKMQGYSEPFWGCDQVRAEVQCVTYASPSASPVLPNAP